MIRLFFAAVLALAFIPIFSSAVFVKSVGSFVFDSDAVVRAAREVHLYGDLRELVDHMVQQSNQAAADASDAEKKIAEGFWKKDLNKLLHEAISEPFFYELTGRWHQGFITLAAGGVDAAWVDFSGVKSKVRAHLEHFGAEQKAQSLNLSPEHVARVASWQKGLADATDRIPDQCTLSQIIEAGGGDSRKYQQALEPVRRNIERLQFIEKALFYAGGAVLGVMALVLVGSIRRMALVLGLSLLVAGLACKLAADRITEFFLEKAKAEALVLVEGKPSHARERVLQITGTVVKHATHHADTWVYGSLALGAALAGVGVFSGLFFSRNSADTPS